MKNPDQYSTTPNGAKAEASPSKDQLPLTRHTPESKIRHPFTLLKDMSRDLKASRELAWRLIIRDISAQYRQTVLGYFWAIFPPLVASLVFVLLRSAKPVGSGNLFAVYRQFPLLCIGHGTFQESSHVE
jgi:hypothetical protein